MLRWGVGRLLCACKNLCPPLPLATTPGQWEEWEKSLQGCYSPNQGEEEGETAACGVTSFPTPLQSELDT